ENLNFIKKYFEKEKIDGDVLKVDLSLEDDIKKVTDMSKNYEVTFMFKLLDTLESIKRNVTENLFLNTQSKTIVVSFPLMSIGGRVKIKSKRSWFEKMSKELEKKYSRTDHEIGNEKYIIYREL